MTAVVFLVLKNDNSVFKKFGVINDGLYYNDNEYPILAISSISSWNTDRVNVSSSHGVKELVPYGKIKIELKGGKHFEFETLKPLEKYEQLALIVNGYLKKMNKPILVKKEETADKLVFVLSK